MDNNVYEVSFDDETPQIPQHPSRKKKNIKRTPEFYVSILIALLIVINISLAIFISVKRKKTEALKKNTTAVQTIQKKVPPNTVNGTPMPINEGKESADDDSSNQNSDENTLENVDQNPQEMSPTPTRIIPTKSSTKIGSPLASDFVVTKLNPTATNVPTQIPTTSISTLNNPSLPSLTPTLVPTSTPIPPTPTPSDPPNVKEIVDNKDTYNGEIIQVVGYIVHGNIGNESCLYMFLCDHSVLVVNEVADLERDLNYDVEVRMSIQEHESDFVLGQKLIFNARVVVTNGVVTFVKMY